LSELVGWRRWTSVLVGIAGVLIVMRPGFRQVEFGHLVALASALCIASSIVCLRVLGSSERPVVIFSVLTSVNLIAVIPMMALTGFALPDLREWALLLLSGLTAGAGQLLLMAATRRAPANQIAPLQYSQLGWAILYGALFFTELPDAATVVGLVFVVASGLFLIQRRPENVVVMPGSL
jgi:S-adenosylmethionine uptake transporter